MGVEVASAEPYANRLHLAPAPHHSAFLQAEAGCSSRRPTNSVEALKANVHHILSGVPQWRPIGLHIDADIVTTF